MLSPYKMLKTALTTIVLHKMVREEPKEFCTPEGFIDDDDDDREIIQISWRDDGIGDFVDFRGRNKDNNLQLQRKIIRDKLVNHFFWTRHIALAAESPSIDLPCAFQMYKIF